jgi:hypothetical protein
MTGPIITWVFGKSCYPVPLLYIRYFATDFSQRYLSTPKFTALRFAIYCALCDHLEMNNRIADAIDCFHQMSSELAEKTITHGEQAKWAVGE